MRIPGKLPLIVILAFTAAAHTQEPAPQNASEFHASNELSVTQNDILGPGKASSSLSKGLNHLEVLKPSVNLGTWYSKDEPAAATDKLYEYSPGLGFGAPDANLTSDLRFGANMLRKSAANTDSDKFFAALSAYWRPKLMAKLNDSTIFLRAGFNNYSFSVANRNFREKSVTAWLNTSF